MIANRSLVFRFDDVEVHEREFSLTKAGKLLTVEPKAFRALLFLLRNPQKLISKEELLNSVWGDVAVSEGSLTRCIWLLRSLLGDDIHSPRYIETVNTVGYRFMCPVEATIDSATAADAPIQSPEPGVRNSVEAPYSPGPDVSKGPERPGRRRLGLALAATGVVVACAALLIAWWWFPRAVPVVESAVQLTEDRQTKDALTSDGVRIYFSEGWPISPKIAQVSVTGGRSVPVETGLAEAVVVQVNHNGSALLVFDSSKAKYGLAWAPLPAGEPRTLGYPITPPVDVFPDGRIIFGTGNDVFITDKYGSNPAKLISLRRPIGSVTVSPDGRRVLVGMIPEGGPYRNQPYVVDIAGDGTSLHQPHLVEIAADGSDLREIRKAAPDECCFRWSPDGRYLIYSARTDKRWDLWALPIRGGIMRRSRKPTQLTNGPLSYPQGAIRSRDGKQIFAVGVKERGELVRYDVKSHQFVPLLGGISATDATYSTDGKWVAYSSYPDHILWRSRSDGSERMQLTYPPLEVQEPFISPDGTKVVFAVPSSGVFTIDINGGPPKRIGKRLASPRWSPDGSSIVVESDTAEGVAGPLQVVDVRTGKAFEVPESGSMLGGPCWLDQETLLVGAEQGRQVTFNLKTGKWTDFSRIDIINLINSPDGKYVYLATLGVDPGVVRIRVADRHLESITSLKDFVRVMNFGWTQLRVAPDGSPTLTRAVDGPEIYALNVRWP